MPQNNVKIADKDPENRMHWAIHSMNYRREEDRDADFKCLHTNYKCKIHGR